MPSETDLAYAAGLVDGEGCIRICKRVNGFHAMVHVANTDIRPLYWLEDTFNGKVASASRKRNPKWKQAYCWRIFSGQAVEFIDMIHPYLKIKASQAQTVFAYDAIQKMKKPWHRWTPEEWAAGLLCFEEVKWLNARGSANKGERPIHRVLREAGIALN